MKISEKVRAAKDGQIQEKPLVREVLNTSLAEEQNELEEIEGRIQDVQLVIDKVATWWARVLVISELQEVISEEENEMYKSIASILEIEGIDSDIDGTFGFTFVSKEDRHPLCYVRRYEFGLLREFLCDRIGYDLLEGKTVKTENNVVKRGLFCLRRP